MNRLMIVYAALFAVVVSCKKDESPVTPPVDYGSITTIVYSQHVQPILTRSCATVGCHSETSPAAGLSVTSWSNLMKGSRNREAVIPFLPERSLLVTLFDGTPLRKVHPSPGAYPLSGDEVSFLRRWIQEGARNDEGSVRQASPLRRLYVPNQAEDNVAIIDLDDLVVQKFVSVGKSPANDAPHYIAANRDFWYVSLIGVGQVWKFDARADTLVGFASIPGSPALLELTPDGSKLYVSQFTTSSQNKVYVINTASMSVTKTITVWTMPHGIRMNRAGTRLYVGNMMSDNFSVIDVATDSVLATVPLAYDTNPFAPPRYMPMEIAVSPNDSLVMVTCSEKREVRMFHAYSFALLDSFQVGDQPWHLQFTPGGEYCYVSNRRGHTVSAIHIPMRHVMTTYSSPSTFSHPHGCDISQDGRYVFISNENVNHTYVPAYTLESVGNVVIIDHVTSQIIKVLDVGRMPTGLSIAR